MLHGWGLNCKMLTFATKKYVTAAIVEQYGSRSGWSDLGLNCLQRNKINVFNIISGIPSEC